MASGSVDRLDEIPSRLRFLFAFDPRSALQMPDVAEVLAHDGADAVVECLARELSRGARLVDRERFRAVVGEIKRQTGQKAKSLFHPIRVALTGAAGGPELDLAVPAIERGAELPADAGLAPILGCRERAAAFAEALRNS
jgi:glutamyl/glutaminyl-tRNA synthetase